jgi:metal-responsive CopG/Arc/MetJ family transcriptional regulator
LRINLTSETRGSIEIAQTTVRLPRKLLEAFDRGYVVPNMFRSRNQAFEALVRQALEEQRKKRSFSEA